MDLKMKVPLAVVLCLFSLTAVSADCVQNAREVSPQLSAETRREFEAKLNEARKSVEADPRSVDGWIWVGRRTAYLGHYKDAIKIYTDAIKQFPSDARLYRHRGHRLTQRSQILKKRRSLSAASPMRSNRTACLTRATYRPALCSQTSGITWGWPII